MEISRISRQDSRKIVFWLLRVPLPCAAPLAYRLRMEGGQRGSGGSSSGRFCSRSGDVSVEEAVTICKGRFWGIAGPCQVPEIVS